jgi:hypothetical protein
MKLYNLTYLFVLSCLLISTTVYAAPAENDPFTQTDSTDSLISEMNSLDAPRTVVAIVGVILSLFPYIDYQKNALLMHRQTTFTYAVFVIGSIVLFVLNYLVRNRPYSAYILALCFSIPIFLATGTYKLAGWYFDSPDGRMRSFFYKVDDPEEVVEEKAVSLNKAREAFIKESNGLQKVALFKAYAEEVQSFGKSYSQYRTPEQKIQFIHRYIRSVSELQELKRNHLSTSSNQNPQGSLTSESKLERDEISKIVNDCIDIEEELRGKLQICEREEMKSKVSLLLSLKFPSARDPNFVKKFGRMMDDIVNAEDYVDSVDSAPKQTLQDTDIASFDVEEGYEGDEFKSFEIKKYKKSELYPQDHVQQQPKEQLFSPANSATASSKPRKVGLTRESIREARTYAQEQLAIYFYKYYQPPANFEDYVGYLFNLCSFEELKVLNTHLRDEYSADFKVIDDYQLYNRHRNMLNSAYFAKKEIKEAQDSERFELLKSINAQNSEENPEENPYHISDFQPSGNNE